MSLKCETFWLGSLVPLLDHASVVAFAAVSRAHRANTALRNRKCTGLVHILNHDDDNIRRVVKLRRALSSSQAYQNSLPDTYVQSFNDPQHIIVRAAAFLWFCPTKYFDRNRPFSCEHPRCARTDMNMEELHWHTTVARPTHALPGLSPEIEIAACEQIYRQRFDVLREVKEVARLEERIHDIRVHSGFEAFTDRDLSLQRAEVLVWPSRDVSADRHVALEICALDEHMHAQAQGLAIPCNRYRPCVPYRRSRSPVDPFPILHRKIRDYNNHRNNNNHRDSTQNQRPAGRSRSRENNDNNNHRNHDHNQRPSGRSRSRENNDNNNHRNNGHNQRPSSRSRSRPNIGPRMSCPSRSRENDNNRGHRRRRRSRSDSR